MSKKTKKIVILTEVELRKTISRLTSEIIEKVKKLDNLLLVGIPTRGIKLTEELEKELLNFAHHYEFEESGLKINDLKKLISEKRVMYDHNVDMRSYKWSGKSILKKIGLDQLPKFISSNIDNYKEWLD